MSRPDTVLDLGNAIYDRLAGWPGLLTPLTGGLYKGWVIQEITRQTAPTAFNSTIEPGGSGSLRPAGLVGLGVNSPVGGVGRRQRGYRTAVDIYLYEPFGRGVILPVARLIQTALLDEEGWLGYAIEHVTDLPYLEETAITFEPVGHVVARYSVTWQGR